MSTSLFSTSVSPCLQILRCIPHERGGSVAPALYRYHGALWRPSVEKSRSGAVLAGPTSRNLQVLLSVLWSPEPSFKTSDYPEATILEIVCQETLSSPSLFESTALRQIEQKRGISSQPCLCGRFVN